MFNPFQFAIGIVLADREKKRLQEQGAVLPSNWAVNQSLLFGVVPNPAVGTVVLQNEIHQKQKELFPGNIRDLQREFNVVKEQGEIAQTNLLNTQAENGQLAASLQAAKAKIDGLAALITRMKEGGDLDISNCPNGPAALNALDALIAAAPEEGGTPPG